MSEQIRAGEGMSERERIQALLDEGRITQEEAELLLEALAEAEAAEAEAEAQAGPTPPPPPRPSLGQPARWLRAKASARNLEVRVDPTLSEPSLVGEAELRSVGTDYELDARPKDPKAWRGWSVHERPLIVTLPGGMGLQVELTAGTLVASDLPYLRAEVKAGNLLGHNLGGIDAEVKAGNLEAELRLSGGQHRVEVKSGNATLRLLPGSDYEITGEVLMGHFESHGRHRMNRTRGFPGMRESFNILEGQGRARLELQVKMGNLKLFT